MRVVILGSGTGSNAAALLQAEGEGRLGRAEVVALVSDRESAPILQLGASFKRRAFFLDPGPFRTKFSDEGDERYIGELKRLEPGLIVLAGFMRIIRRSFIETFPEKLINLHPSLLPSFPGLDGIGQAWRRGVRVTGCTVHFVTPEVDAGPIIDQAPVRVEDDDTLESLARKVHAAEHQLLPSVVARLSEGWRPPKRP